MPSNVKCSVSNCTYWGEGNNCNAELIMVDIDPHAKKHLEEFAGEFGYDSEREDVADERSLTCCHTFKPKR